MEEVITISRSEYDQLKAQAVELAELKALVDRLMAEIALLKNGHNNKTNSTPSSQDIARSNTMNLRVKSGHGQTAVQAYYSLNDMETRKREMNALIVVSKRYNIKNLDNQQKNKKNILERGLEIEVMPIGNGLL